MELSTIKVNEINRLHFFAQSSARNAIECAHQIGTMLIEEKRRLKHGKFLLWMRDNLKFTIRTGQRYMAVAEGKKFSMLQLASKNDTVSHLGEVIASEGEWRNGVWLPEHGGSYIFNDETGSYFVNRNEDRTKFHISKLYDGERQSSKGAYWRYTVFAEVTDPDFECKNYIGTRYPLTMRNGVEGVLRSYGLKDLKSSFVLGTVTKNYGLHRPYGEPEKENWYWDAEKPEDELFKQLTTQGFINQKGACTYID